MKIEQVFSRIKEFSEMKMDTILFECQYPVLFTCINKGKVYLFSCCTVNSQIMKWIGTETDYSTLINLLKNRITIYDAFQNVTDTKVLIEFDGSNVNCKWKHKSLIPQQLLPTKGEYMDAEEDEFEEEIKTFEQRISET